MIRCALQSMIAKVYQGKGNLTHRACWQAGKSLKILSMRHERERNFPMVTIPAISKWIKPLQKLRFRQDNEVKPGLAEKFSHWSTVTALIAALVVFLISPYLAYNWIKDSIPRICD